MLIKCYNAIRTKEQGSSTKTRMASPIRTLRPLAQEELSKMPAGKTKEVMVMLVPSIFGENLFDDWFDFPQWPDFNRRRSCTADMQTI